MANLEGKLSQYVDVVMYTRANSYLIALNSSMKTSIATTITANSSYLSKYEIIDELRTNLKEDYRLEQPPGSELDSGSFETIKPLLQLDQEILSIVASDEAGYELLSTYMDDLADNIKGAFDPPIFDAFTVQELEVYPIPQSSLKDPRRGARLIVFEEFPKAVRDWLINNALLYGFTLYQNYGLYYIGFAEVQGLITNNNAVVDLINKFQQTPIPAGDIALTAVTVQAAEDPGMFSGGCQDIPQGKGKNVPANVITAASTGQDAVNYIISNLEGGYYHPTHALTDDSSNIEKQNNVKGNYGVMHNSGETIFGLDRVAGEWSKRPDGKAFWDKMDKLTGNGGWGGKGNKNDTVKTKDWPYEKRASNSWGYGAFPGRKAGFTPNTGTPPAMPELVEEAGRMITGNFNRYMDLWFKDHPAKQVILSDGRSVFMFYRAVWNGIGYFKKYAENVIAKYDSGITRVEDLICEDLTFRYETKTESFKKGVWYLKEAMEGF